MNTKLVAEIGINHNGDLNITKKLIDAANDNGIQYVKFQKRILEETVPMEERNKMKETPWGNISYMDYKKHLEFEFEDYHEIDKYCSGTNVEWFASPWGPKAAEFILDFDMPYIKIAGASISDFEMFEVIKSNTSTPLIISTGMASKKEVDACLDFFGDQVEYILACTSTYPTKDQDMNLNFIKTLKSDYSMYRIGFSNHHPGVVLSLVAAGLGAEMIEFHCTVDRSMFGSDQAASIEIPGMIKLARDIQSLELAMGTGEWKVTEEEKKIKQKLTRK